MSYELDKFADLKYELLNAIDKAKAKEEIDNAYNKFNADYEALIRLEKIKEIVLQFFKERITTEDIEYIFNKIYASSRSIEKDRLDKTVFETFQTPCKVPENKLTPVQKYARSL